MAVQIYVPGVVQLVKNVGLLLLVSYKLCFIIGLGLIPYPGMVDVPTCCPCCFLLGYVVPFGSSLPLRN